MLKPAAYCALKINVQSWRPVALLRSNIFFMYRLMHWLNAVSFRDGFWLIRYACVLVDV